MLLGICGIVWQFGSIQQNCRSSLILALEITLAIGFKLRGGNVLSVEREPVQWRGIEVTPWSMDAAKKLTKKRGKGNKLILPSFPDNYIDL